MTENPYGQSEFTVNPVLTNLISMPFKSAQPKRVRFVSLVKSVAKTKFEMNANAMPIEFADFLSHWLAQSCSQSYNGPTIVLTRKLPKL